MKIYFFTLCIILSVNIWAQDSTIYYSISPQFGRYTGDRPWGRSSLTEGGDAMGVDINVRKNRLLLTAGYYYGQYYGSIGGYNMSNLSIGTLSGGKKLKLRVQVGGGVVWEKNTEVNFRTSTERVYYEYSPNLNFKAGLRFLFCKYVGFGFDAQLNINSVLNNYMLFSILSFEFGRIR